MFLNKEGNTTLYQARNLKYFTAEEILWIQGTLIKFSSKTQKKRPHRQTIWKLFLLDTLQTTFWMEDLTQVWTQLGSFFPKSGHFSRFSKKGRGGSPSCFYMVGISVMKELNLNREINLALSSDLRRLCGTASML